MKHNLVVSVSPDSSLDLLGRFADILLLDTDTIPSALKGYETIYIRSHFSQPSTLPQNYRREINNIVAQVKEANPSVIFVDAMDTVDAIVAFEDKWHQYETFGSFMPLTERYTAATDVTMFTQPLFKKRLSSRGRGVTWDKANVNHRSDDWVIQETLAIKEELRIYVICGEVYPIGVIRSAMTEQSAVNAIDSRELTQDEKDFAYNVAQRCSAIDMIGLDIARTSDGALYVMEANRSPGFAKFETLTGVDLAGVLYEKLSGSK